MDRDLVDDVENSRFEWREDGFLAFADYRLKPGRLIIPHMETDPAARGRGLAGRLMAAIVENARGRGLKIEPVCPYADAWFRRHPQAAAELRA
jgi:predicted GNAT family acetyltransferase